MKIFDLLHDRIVENEKYNRGFDTFYMNSMTYDKLSEELDMAINRFAGFRIEIDSDVADNDVVFFKRKDVQKVREMDSRWK